MTADREHTLIARIKKLQRERAEAYRKLREIRLSRDMWRQRCADAEWQAGVRR